MAGSEGALAAPQASGEGLAQDRSKSGTVQAEAPKKKICCACPNTKRLRDECIALNGPDSAECLVLIEAHKVCLRSEGFKV
ncbi:Cytochrome c oxidase assembly protein/Cu2+ chaperone COX17 [Klebsormidium nitens]|uniref:Cytochrome c oxidase assembly protein/Cu2+ chaperone COX17 n=1 Tax=Klebsormidium nitens TaxID=105231 RepID=A0A1Y1HMM2_KLENI|nr:Cytochrome c oxidase assembly protein/Cu2+ chaperone COX17 [Klebsormidium nitens]|eukprot:GAQ79864.1 Cytochrome c oxidase assembly protein/Cu2+ chaperone COX17 [Klebsormidium nitens]